MGVPRRCRSLHVVILGAAASLVLMVLNLPRLAPEQRPLYPLESSSQHNLSLASGTKHLENTTMFSSTEKIQISSIKPSGTEVTHNSSVIERKKKHFVVSITNDEREKFRVLMETFAEVMPENVTYFMYSGTLIGSYRHHGMIPWDDDLDLMVRETDKGRVSEALNRRGPDLVTKKGSHSLKFYHRSSIRTKFGWNWPFLDIFFFSENSTHLWDTHPTWKGHKYLKEDILPLTKRPFMGMLLPAPRNTAKVLKKLYDIDLCETKFYNHKKEEFMEKNTLVKVPCVELEDMFTFVKRRHEGDTIIETITDKSGNSSNFSSLR